MDKDIIYEIYTQLRRHFKKSIFKIKDVDYNLLKISQ